MMRFYLLLKIIIVLYFITYMNENRKIELEQLASVVQDTNGIINEWSLYAREPIELSTNKQVIEKATGLQKQFPEMNWSKIETNQSVKWIGQQTIAEVTETITLIYSKNEQSFLLYQLAGRGHPSKNVYDTKRLNTIFMTEPDAFSCVKGVFIEGFAEASKYTIDEIIYKLQAMEMESLREENFISISAYSPSFTHAIPLEENEMNVQLALRQMNEGETEFIIGTPILVIEY